MAHVSTWNYQSIEDEPEKADGLLSSILEAREYCPDGQLLAGIFPAVDSEEEEASSGARGTS